jgi:hypothetical protein
MALQRPTAWSNDLLKGFNVALGLFTLLKTVPWSDVISTAPVVADGAKRLWKAVAKKTVPAASAEEGISTAISPSNADLAQAHTRLASLETRVTELQQEMLDSSELIKALAEQNAELVKRAEAHRIRLLGLTFFVVIAGALAIVSLVLLSSR